MPRASKTPKKDYYNQAINCFGHYQKHDGRWQDYLDSSRRLVLEVGCGKADFGLQLAALHPEIDIVGVDLKSDRMSKAAKAALRNGLTNIAFLQADIRDISDFFEPGSIDEIWLTFPDPHPKKRGAKHRLSGRQFLTIYRDLLIPGGRLNLKTDSKELFEWSLEQLADFAGLTLEDNTNDLHGSEGRSDAKLITAFEERFLAEGIPTNYLRASRL